MQKIETPIETFIKEQIEGLRDSTIELTRVNELGVIDEEEISRIDGPIYEVAYNLLKEIYLTAGDSEEIIFNNFIDYMSGRTYKNLDEFLAWLEEV